jgi:hypothetical protein
MGKWLHRRSRARLNINFFRIFLPHHQIIVSYFSQARDQLLRFYREEMGLGDKFWAWFQRYPMWISGSSVLAGMMGREYCDWQPSDVDIYIPSFIFEEATDGFEFQDKLGRCLIH